MQTFASLAQLDIPLSVGLLSDEEFERFCASNPSLKIERNADLTIKIMTPLSLDADDIESELQARLRAWTWDFPRGKIYNSQSGFQMPDRSILSPDAAFVSFEKLRKLTKEQRRHIPHLVPDFVAEVLSPTDSLDELKAKMERWMSYGVSLAWLVDPENRQVFIYRADGSEPEVILGFNRILEADGILQGFTLNLNRFAEILDF